MRRFRLLGGADGSQPRSTFYCLHDEIQPTQFTMYAGRCTPGGLMEKHSFKPVAGSWIPCCRGAVALASILLLPIGSDAQGLPERADSEAHGVHKTPVQEDNASCAGLDKSMKKRVTEINALQEAIDKDKTGPAPSVLGMIKNWMGQPYTAESLKKKQEQLERARRRADAINDLRAASGCTHIDVDDEVHKIAAKKPVPPSQPDN